MKTIKLLICVFIFSCQYGYGQDNILYDPYVKFDFYNIKNGLSNNRIIDVFQDQKGYLWVGTERGLNRFDGYEFDETKLESRATNHGGFAKIIADIVEDQYGNLWIGTDKGLFMKSPQDSIIQIYPLTGSVTQKEIYVMAVLIDAKGNVWFDTAAGDLILHDTSNNSFKKFNHEAPGQIYTYYYHQLYQDKKGLIWIGGRGLDVCSFSPDLKKYKYYRADPGSPQKKRIRDVTRYLESSDGTFWVAGMDGLYTLDRNTGIFKLYMSQSCLDIIEDNQSNLWVINGNKLKIISLSDNRLTVLEQSIENKFSIPSKYILNLNLDNAGNIWIGTLEGLAKYSASKNKFKGIYKIIDQPQSLTSAHVTSIIESNDGEIWIGTENHGIDILNQSFQKINRISKETPGPYRIESNAVSKLFKDVDGIIYIGLWSGSGFHLIDNKSGTNDYFSLEQDNQQFDWYSDFVQDKNGTIWIGTWGSYSLVEFEPKRKIFPSKPTQAVAIIPQLNSHFINNLMIDRNGYIWIGTSNKGLVRYNPGLKLFESFHSHSEKSKNYLGNSVHCIFEDKKGRVWVSSDGLFLYDESDHEFRKIITLTGAGISTILSIIEDKRGDFWMGTTDGIVKYDPEHKIIERFTEKDGLPDNECTKASCLLKNGKIMIGTKNGIAVFDPENIQFSAYEAIPNLKSYSIFQEKFPLAGHQKNGEVLKYDRNYLRFDFFSSDLTDPKSNHFSFKLENFDENWKTTSGVDNYTTYTYLQPGQYNFRVKSSNSDGIWNELEANFKFKIIPPFWKRWWFILLEIIAGLGLIWVYIKYREDRLKKKHQLSIAEQRLFRSQMNPHFIFNALSAIQSYILSNKPLEASSYLARFSDLVRSILYNSREETVSLDSEIKTVTKYMLIQQLRFENKFDFKINIDPKLSTEFVGVPPMLLQPFIENSIEHGFRDIEYKGIIDLDFVIVENKLQVNITDNGIGILAGRQKSGKNKEHKSLALEITKERLQRVNNTKKLENILKVEDLSENEQKRTGTRISFFIPIFNM